MSDTDLTFESTTDTPEQMREGLGLAPEPLVEHVAEESPAVPPTETPVAEAPPVAAQEQTTTPAVASTVGRARGADGKFVAAPKPADPVAEALAAAKAEAEALKAQVEELKKPKAEEQKPAPPVQAPSAPEPPSFDVDAYRDPAVTAKFQKLREAIGAEPQQLDDDDYTVYQQKLRAYDRKLAVLEAKEEVAHQRAAEQAVAAEQKARADVQSRFTSYEERRQAAEARHADWKETMEAGNKLPFGGRPHAQDIQRALIEMEDGPETVYYIAKHPEELEKLQRLPSAHLAIIELGKIAARAVAAASTTTMPTGATQTGPSTIVSTRPISKAPEPQGTTLGGGSTVTVATPETAKDYAEYKRVRNEQIRRKLGR